MVWFFRIIDSNRDGFIERREWKAAASMMSVPHGLHGLVARRTEARGLLAKPARAWKEMHGVPEALHYPIEGACTWSRMAASCLA